MEWRKNNQTENEKPAPKENGRGRQRVGRKNVHRMFVLRDFPCLKGGMEWKVLFAF